MSSGTGSSSTTAGHSGTSVRRPKALLGAASVAVALAAADTYVVVLALTEMMAGVGIGIDALQRATPIISGFLLGYIAVLPLIGRLSDLLDRQRILLGCLLVFAVGSGITALATDMGVLVTGRVIQGVGGGGLVPATLALVADLWPPRERGTPLGVVGAVQELGSVLGPVLGALVLSWKDWRAIFWLNVIAAVLLWVVIRVLGRGVSTATSEGGEGDGRPARARRSRLALRVLATLLLVVGLAVLALALKAPESLLTSVQWGGPFVPFEGQTSKLATPIGVVAAGLILPSALLALPLMWSVLRRADLLGALLIAVALGSLVLTFSSSNPEKEVVGPLGLKLLPVGAVAVVLYAVWHRIAAQPLVPRGVVRARGARALVVSLLVGAALVAVIVDVPIMAVLTVTDSATQGALILVRFLVALPVGAVLGGMALRRVGPGVVAGIGMLLGGAGLLVMHGWGPKSMEHTVSMTLTLVLVGFGLGLALAPVNAAVLADSPHDAHGVASSLVVVARMVGMVVGLALLTAIGLNRYYDEAAKVTDPTNTDALIAAGLVQVQTVFLGGSIAALLAGLIAFTLGTRPEEGAQDAPRVALG